MHEECVPAETARLARDLARLAPRHQLALGGGTACALRLGHRTSRDLDFFSLQPLDPPALLADLSTLDDQRLRGISERELSLTVAGVELFATSLGRAPLDATDDWHGIPVLAGIDLAELKVEAAVRRGMIRDLCDLHLLCLTGVDLEAVLRAGETDTVVALKALTEVERFSDQPAPALRQSWRVEEAIDYFKAEARRILGGPEITGS